MAKKSLNLTGTAGQTYDLDQIEQETRLNAERPLVIQVHKYNPASQLSELNKNPNPSSLKLGQMWLSKKDNTL
jgi:hypothetical protein